MTKLKRFKVYFRTPTGADNLFLDAINLIDVTSVLIKRKIHVISIVEIG